MAEQMETNYKKEFIKFMVQSNVLTFGDFTAKSGRKTSYFINTGNYKTGAQIAKLGEFYASRIQDSDLDGIDALFGPAYKGIPLCVAASIALYNKYNVNVNYCFNRKEAKDHGEGGAMVGYKLRDGDKVVIIEDVITAGTAIRESLPLLQAAADVNVAGLIISVDRMERGQGDKTAIAEVYEEFGIKAYPIVTVMDIIDSIYNEEIDGKVVLDAAMRDRMLAYIDQYGVK